MKNLECTIFNVEHGFCAFIKSPSDYGLLIDCGSRGSFSPVKWVQRNYNFGNKNIKYFKNRRIAELLITHPHMDHFDDVGSLIQKNKPKHLLVDRETVKYVDEKIKEEKDERKKEILVNLVIRLPQPRWSPVRSMALS